MSFPKTTRFGVDPTRDVELANKRYVDASGGSSPLTTKGDLFGFSNVDARIPIGTNGFHLEADSSEALGLKWATPSGGGLTFAKVVKSVDQTVNNSSTLQDDDELKFTPNINKAYFGTMFTIYSSGTTPDLKSAFSLPTGASGEWLASNGLWRMATQSFPDITTAIAQISGIVAQTFAEYFRIQMGSTAGEIIYQWSQNVANVSDTKVLIGSCLVVYEE